MINGFQSGGRTIVIRINAARRTHPSAGRQGSVIGRGPVVIRHVQVVRSDDATFWHVSKGSARFDEARRGVILAAWRDILDGRPGGAPTIACSVQLG